MTGTLEFQEWLDTLMNSTDDADWNSCPAGMLSDFSVKQRKLAQKRSLTKLGGGAAALIGGCLLIVAVFVYANDRQPDGGGITVMNCRQVLRHMDSFLAGDLQGSELEGVRAHLKDCKRCRDHYQHRASQLGVAFSLVAGPSWPVITTSYRALLAMR